MGDLEKKSKKRRQKHELQKAILASVAAVGFLSVAMLAPNSIKYARRYADSIFPLEVRSVHRSRRRLVDAGLLKYNNRKLLELTPKGEAKLRRLELAGYKFQKPKKWDGKWRMLIFDISEKRKSLRDKVRRTLQIIGFTRLQDSVWVYPYSCDDLITLLKADFKIGEDLLYVIADEIEYDNNLKAHFGLQ